MSYLKFQRWCKEKRAQLYTRLVRSDFGRIGKNTLICTPFFSNNASEVYLGENCKIQPGGWIDSIREYAGVKYNGRIEIGDRAYLGHRVALAACQKMVIGNDVVFADNVYISDLLHSFDDINLPIFKTNLVSSGPVVIEDQVWLGQRVCVLPNVRIGRHSVVGANSVVTKDIPPCCVAAGVPAKIIKTHNPETNLWERVSHSPEAIG